MTRINLEDMMLSEIGTSQKTSQVALVVKNPPVNARNIRDASSIPGSGRSLGGGHGNPLQYSCLGISGTEEPGELQSMKSQRVVHN